MHIATTELARILGQAELRLAAVSDLLDAMTSSERVEAVRSLGGKAQKRLWELAQGSRPLLLTCLVPASTPAMTEVVHYGRNSLPAFTRFEKRFYRMPEAKAAAPTEVYGANFQTMSPLTGPGYFVATENPKRREIHIDYHQLPTAAPSGWPAIVSNERGVTRLVYGSLTDDLRSVSEHVTIGAPARHGRPLGSYFLLCRRDD